MYGGFLAHRNQEDLKNYQEDANKSFAIYFLIEKDVEDQDWIKDCCAENWRYDSRIQVLRWLGNKIVCYKDGELR